MIINKVINYLNPLLGNMQIKSSNIKKNIGDFVISKNDVNSLAIFEARMLKMESHCQSNQLKEINIIFDQIDFAVFDNNYLTRIRKSLISILVNNVAYAISFVNCKNVSTRFAYLIQKNKFEDKGQSIIDIERFNSIINARGTITFRDTIMFASIYLTNSSIPEVIEFNGIDFNDPNEMDEMTAVVSLIDSGVIKHSFQTLVFKNCKNINSQSMSKNLNALKKSASVIKIMNSAGGGGFGGLFGLDNGQESQSAPNDDSQIASAYKNLDELRNNPDLIVTLTDIDGVWRKMGMGGNVRQQQDKQSSPDYQLLSSLPHMMRFKLSPFSLELQKKLTTDFAYRQQFRQDIMHILDTYAIGESGGVKLAKEQLTDMFECYVRNGKFIGKYLLLVGPPGCGKTVLASKGVSAVFWFLECGKKQECLQLYYDENNAVIFQQNPNIDSRNNVLSGPNVTSKSSIVGNAPVFQNAGPGYVTQVILNARKGVNRSGGYGVGVTIDELDKLNKSASGEDLGQPMISMFESFSRDSFRDLFFNVTFVLSYILITATANDLKPISAPIKDRLRIIEMNYNSPEDMIKICEITILKILWEHKVNKKMYAFESGLFLKLCKAFKPGSIRFVIEAATGLSNYIIAQYNSSGGKQIIITEELLNNLLEQYNIDLNQKILTTKPGRTFCVTKNTEGSPVYTRIDCTMLSGKFKHNGGLVQVLTFGNRQGNQDANHIYTAKNNLQDLLATSLGSLQNLKLLAMYMMNLSSTFTISLDLLDPNNIMDMSIASLLAMISALMNRAIKPGYFFLGTLGINGEILSSQNLDSGLDRSLITYITFLLHSDIIVNKIYLPKSQEVFANKYMSVIETVNQNNNDNTSKNTSESTTITNKKSSKKNNNSVPTAAPIKSKIQIQFIDNLNADVLEEIFEENFDPTLSAYKTSPLKLS